MTDNPLNAIEDKNGMIDMGKMCYYIFLGAKMEGASDAEAYMLVICHVAGIGASNHFKPQEEDEEVDGHSN